MATASTKVLSEALKLSVQERVRVAEKLLESADAEGYEDESEVAIHAAWADEIKQLIDVNYFCRLATTILAGSPWSTGGRS